MATQCLVCGRGQGQDHILKQCGWCHGAVYCSRHCQKVDWPRHREEHKLGLYARVPDTPAKFNVQLATLSGQILEIEDCTGTLTVAELKAKIEEKTGIPPYDQELILDTEVLADRCSLRSVGVGEGTCLSFVRNYDPPPPLVDSSDDDIDDFERFLVAL